MKFEMNVIRFEAEDVIATSQLVPPPTDRCLNPQTKHLYIGPAYEGSFKVTQYDYDNGAYTWKETVDVFSEKGMAATKSYNDGLEITTGQWYFKDGNNWKYCGDASTHQQ